jgi:MSHA type pilus biogenesis protein MshL
MRKYLVLVIGICFLFTTNVYSEAPKEIQSSGSISSQVISKESVTSPYMITGESLVGLLKEMVDFDIEDTSIAYHRKTGKLFVKNTPKNQALVQKVLAQLRTYEARQVMIEARIIEVFSFDGFDLGVDWSNINLDKNNSMHNVAGDISLPSSGWGNTSLNPLDNLNLTYGYVSGLQAFDFRLTALERDNKINTLSSPKIVCFNNQRANIKIETATDYVSRIDVDTIYAGTSGSTPSVHTSVDVETAVEGILLDVTPTINTDNTSITLELHPTVIELVSLTSVDLNNGESISVPKYVRRSADTTVSLKDGGTIVIGGLMKRTEKTDVRKVPILGDIPLIGNFFRAETKYEEKSSLLIFITAKIKDN